MADSGSDAALPKQFIVQGEPVKSGRLADHLKKETGVKQVTQVAPDVVVLSMTPAQADRLKSTFTTLMVEADSELKPFGHD